MIKPAALSEAKQSGGVWRFVAWVCLAAAVAATLILASLNMDFRIASLIHWFLFALVYSSSIGAPACSLLLYVGRRRFAAGKQIGWVPRFVVMLTSSLTGCLVAGVVLVAVGLNPPRLYWQEFRTSLLFSTMITLTFGISVSFYQEVSARLQNAMLELRTRQVEEERARKLAAEARLSSLESRIHPHFLFNTLNAISALIPKDPKRAEDMVGKLAALLRFSLNAPQAGLVPLRQEMEIVKAYLEIEKARFDARLRYSIDVPEEAQRVGVPPLAIGSLVENSIKHVIAKRAEGGEVHVRAFAEDGRVALEVSDTGPGFAMDSVPPGHGLDSLASRLSLLFGERASLAAVRSGPYAAVRVVLPREV
jgi:sensor histidine kinase YesM